MLAFPLILPANPQLTAVVELKVPRKEIGAAIPSALKELKNVVSLQGIGPVGPWFAHHFRMVPDVFDLEVGVPVKGPVVPVGRVKGGKLQTTKVARTTYVGGFEQLPAVWAEFNGWLVENGYKPADDFWESYVVGYDTNPDPAKWVTELNRPVIG